MVDMDESRLVREVRTPRSAAIAGMIFAVILGAVIVLLHSAAPAQAEASSTWITDPARRQALSASIALIPFAGIAFLWFIGVIRARLGEREDKFLATVVLGSGLLFVAMLFSAGAVIAAALILADGIGGISAETQRLTAALATVLLGQFGARMAAVFALSVTTIGLRTRVVPRWLAAIGYLTGVSLLLSPPLPHWAQLLFPGWVLVLSVQILVVSRRNPQAEGSRPSPQLAPRVPPSDSVG